MRSSAPPSRAWLARWYSALRSPPFQNSSSKASVLAAARLSANILRKICHHDHSDSTSSSTITACTTTLACMTMAMNERSGCRFKRLSPFVPAAPRNPRSAASCAGRARRARRARAPPVRLAAHDVLRSDQPCPAAFDRRHRDCRARRRVAPACGSRSPPDGPRRPRCVRFRARCSANPIDASHSVRARSRNLR